MIRHLALLSVLAVACGPVAPLPAGFPPLPEPADNALTPERVELGRRLFHDVRLSRTREVSCASCHLQQDAFADPRAVSVGVQGRTGVRNAPALVNLAWNTSFFWDGGAKTLEQQIIGPLTNPLEMDMTMGEVVARVAADPELVKRSLAAYGVEPRPDVVTRAIAAFVRTLISGGSRYDRFRAGDRSALTAPEQRGMDLALGERGECFHCHVGFNLTNNGFANNGMNTADPGRARVTEDAADLGKFKVPTLRNVARTSPYMHDGSLRTLEEVVEHYSRGGQGHPNTDPTISARDFTAQEKADLLAFLESLTDEAFLQDGRFEP